MPTERSRAKTAFTMRKASLLSIFLVVLVDLIGFGIVIPILPYYAQQYGASAQHLGWLMATYSLMQFLVSPIWGKLSDRYGRRPILLFTIFGTSASMTALGFAHTLPMIFLARLLAGFFAANISTAYAYITDITDESNRAKGMGIIGAGFGLGFILGPAMGGILYHYGHSYPMFAAAGLAWINLAFAFAILKEPELTTEARAKNRGKKFSLDAFQQALSHPLSGVAILLFLIMTTAVTQMEVIFAIFLKALYGFDARQAGFLLAATGIIMAAIQGGLIGRLAKRFGEGRLALTGGLLCAAGLAIFAQSSQLSLSVIGLLIMAVGHGILHPSLSSLTSLGARPESRGATMGVFQSAGSLARIIGPPSAGWLYEHVSMRAPFWAASSLCLGVAVIALVRVIPLRRGITAPVTS